MSATEHILVVDDNADVRNVIREILREAGYRASEAPDGPSMREFLKTGEPVDAIILDAVMPGEPGVSLALHARQLRIPLVMISGSMEAQNIAAENRLHLLDKPFHAHQLIEAVVQAIRGARPEADAPT